MKRVLTLLFAIVLCLALCACGKSEAVQNVETMIAAIGDVTLESEDAIVAAENAYAALTEKEQQKVENAAALTEARAALDPLIAEELARQPYYGTWTDVKCSFRSTHTFTQDNRGYWQPTATGITINDESFTREEVHGTVRLVNADRSICYYREEDLTTTEVEITLENYQDYFTLEKQVFNLHYDDFGELKYYELCWCARVKDDVRDRLVAVSTQEEIDKYKVAIEVGGDGGSKWACLDPDTLEGGVDANWMYRSDPEYTTKMGAMEQYNMFSFLIDPDGMEIHPKQEGLVPFVSIGFAYWDEEYSPEWYTFHNYIPNPEVLRLQGTLLLYELPVHQD